MRLKRTLMMYDAACCPCDTVVPLQSIVRCHTCAALHQMPSDCSALPPGRVAYTACAHAMCRTRTESVQGLVWKSAGVVQKVYSLRCKRIPHRPKTYVWDQARVGAGPKSNILELG